jgi:hypothetical protein
VLRGGGGVFIFSLFQSIRFQMLLPIIRQLISYKVFSQALFMTFVIVEEWRFFHGTVCTWQLPSFLHSLQLYIYTAGHMALALRSKILKCTLGPLQQLFLLNIACLKTLFLPHKDQTISLSIAVIHSRRKKKKMQQRKMGKS